MRIAPLFFFCFILHINSAYSEVYKWIDENGKTVYGDKPVSEDADVVKIKKKPAVDKAYQERVEKQQKLLNVMQDEREEKIAAEKKDIEEKEKQKKECSEMKQKLQKFKDSIYLYEETNDPDNPRIYSDKERDVEQGKYESYIKENC